MALSVFADKAQGPTPAMIEKALGRSAERWKKIVAALADAVGPVTEHWNSAAAKYGWSMRLRFWP